MEVSRVTSRRVVAPIISLILLASLALETCLYGGSREEVGLFFAALQLLTGSAALILITPSSDPVADREMRATRVAFLILLAWSMLALVPLPGGGGWSVTSLRPFTTVTEGVKFAGLAFTFAAGRLAFGHGPSRRLFATSLAAAALIYSSGCVVSHLWPSSAILTHQAEGPARLRATFLSPNTAATFMGALCVLFAARALEDAGGAGSAPRWLDSCAALSCLGALWMTGSRGGVICTSSVLVVLLLVRLGRWRDNASRRSSRLGSTLLAGGLLAALITPLIGGLTAWRMGAALEDMGQRTLGFARLWRSVVAHPWLGTGLGTLRPALVRVLEPTTLTDIWNLGAAHNVELQWAVETGLVGAGVAVVMTAELLAACLRRAKTGGPAGAPARMALAFSGVVLLQGQVDFALQIPAVATAWVLVMAWAMPLRSEVRSRASKSKPVGRRDFERCSKLPAGAVERPLHR